MVVATPGSNWLRLHMPKSPSIEQLLGTRKERTANMIRYSDSSADSSTLGVFCAEHKSRNKKLLKRDSWHTEYT